MYEMHTELSACKSSRLIRYLLTSNGSWVLLLDLP